ncbi:MAG: radical protein, partial [Sedimentibacter sp.]|nr:radical protein [Sedimentibacter sp.]
MDFLPINIDDMKKRGWEQCDFIFVTGDAYVDHSSFAVGIISRLLERYGYKVGIIAQPDWKDINSFKKLGEPRLGFLVNSGNIDSMVNHYTTFKKKRSTDAYSPGGAANLRPDRAVTVYSNRLREAYKHIPIIIGGIEASLRRLSHYDYWSDNVKRSVLLDSGA